MQVGFLPFIANLVTDPFTLCTVMKNVVSVGNQIEKEYLPMFCNGRVWSILLNTCLKKPVEFQKLILMMGITSAWQNVLVLY